MKPLTRRTVLGSAAVLTPLALPGQNPQRNPPPSGRRVSPAVHAALLRSLADVQNRIQQKQPLAPGLRGLAITSGIYFDHLDELGITAAVELQVRATGQAGPLTGPQIQALQSKTPLPLDLSRQDPAGAQTQMVHHTFREMNRAFVANLNAFAEQVAKNEAARPEIQLADCWTWGWVLWYFGMVALFSPPPVDAGLTILLAIIGTIYQIFC